MHTMHSMRVNVEFKDDSEVAKAIRLAAAGKGVSVKDAVHEYLCEHFAPTPTQPPTKNTKKKR